MGIYFLIIRIAAFFGHRKARLLYHGQAKAIKAIQEYKAGKAVNTRAGSRAPLQNPIWIHVSSVGEFEQARPIIERLRKEQPKTPVILTFFSPSGYELRKNYDKVDIVTYLPFATERNTKAFLDEVKPRMAIFVKYEFWPAYLKELHKRGITTYSISAIFREGQLFFRPWGKWYLELLTYFKRIFVQEQESKALLERYGITGVEVAGDTRFDRVTEIANQAKTLPVVEQFIRGDKNQIRLDNHTDPIIVAGSTWPKDETLLARYIEEHPEVKLILVPHEITPGHLHTIFQLFEGKYVRYSEATEYNLTHVRVLVIDTIGMLSSIYRYGQVSYIGGGFGHGIHNTLEAAVYGMPVIFGPNYHHFREAKGLIACGGGFSINNYNTLQTAMDNALANYIETGNKAKRYVESELGATTHIYSELFEQQRTLF